jgi:hypothetical protein
MASDVFESFKGKLKKQWTDSKVLRYSDKNDFNDLWNIKTLDQDVVIIWDGFPTDDSPNTRLLKNHITPIDWAICYAGTTDEVTHGVHVIDCTNIEFLDCFAVKYRHQILAELSFIKLYAVVGAGKCHSRMGHLPLLPAGTLTLQETLKGNFKRAAADALRLWRDTLQRHHDHHDLNNIIGPSIARQLLNKSEESSSKSEESSSKSEESSSKSEESSLPIEAAMQQKMLSLTAEKPKSVVYQQAQDIEKFGFIDDFTAWPTLLGSKLNIVGSDPCNEDDLCGLKAIIDEFSAEKLQARHFDLPPWPENKCSSSEAVAPYKRPEALVIDLRLFTGTKQAELYEELRKAAESIKSSTKLAWDGFDAVELAHAQCGDESVLQSLLPRLCALRWPTVPIIIFTASAKRDVLDKLRPYGNIIIGPRKPDLMAANAAEKLEEFLLEFKLVVEKAQKSFEPAEKLRKLTDKTHHVEAGQPQNIHSHFVLAFDEFGNFSDEPSGVQFAMLESTGKNQAEAMQESMKFQEAVRATGAHMGYPPIYLGLNQGGASIVTGRQKDQKLIFNEQVNNRLSATTRSRIYFAAVRAISGRQRGLVTSRFLAVLNMALEFAIFELAERCSASTKSIEIWFATRRMTEINAQNAARLDVHQFEGSAQLTGQGVGLQLLSRALENRSAPEFVLNPHVRVTKIPYHAEGIDSGITWRNAAGTRLSYRDHELTKDRATKSAVFNRGGEAAYSVYSPVSHFADAAFTGGTYIGPSHENALLKDVLDNANVQNLLRSGRSLHRSELQSALREWSKLPIDFPVLAKSRLERDLQKAIKTAKGSVLMFWSLAV